MAKGGGRATRAPRCPWWVGPPLAAPGGRQGGVYLPWCPTLAPIFTLDEEISEKKSLSQFSSRSRFHPLFFPGRANLEDVLASFLHDLNETKLD